MKHRPQLPDDSVNIGRQHPLREMLRLGTALLVAAALLFILSGWLVDVIVQRLDPGIGAGLRPQISAAAIAQFGPNADTARARRAHELFTELIDATGRDRDRYRLMVLDHDLVNAAALPGGIIVVFTGLLEQAQSENELAMVLGHELGHLDNKDHLRQLGRGIVAAGTAALMFGNTSALDARMLSMVGGVVHRRFSRSSELSADVVGLHAVCKRYQHSGGAIDFFARNIGRDAAAGLFASHPASAERVARLQALAIANDCPDGPTAPLP